MKSVGVGDGICLNGMAPDAQVLVAKDQAPCIADMRACSVSTTAHHKGEVELNPR
jgi:hypothetical protein